MNMVNRNRILNIKSKEAIFKACINITNDYPLPGQFLHEEEAHYLKTLQYEKRIKSYLLGRYSAKNAISELINESDLKKIKIKSGIFNQPIVECELKSNLQISIAHSEEQACSIAFHEQILMGIDMEKMKDSTRSTILSELTQPEKDLLHRTPELFLEPLLIFWTAKESLSKIIKTGLTIPMRILEINSVEWQSGFLISTFTNFFQYQTMSWFENDTAFSITYPKNLIMELELRDKFSVENRFSVSRE